MFGIFKKKEEKEEVMTDLSEALVGYTVYINTKNELVFDTFGQKQTLVELLGLHEIATTKLKLRSDNNLFGNSRLIHEVGLGVAACGKKLEEISARLDELEK